MAAASVFVSRGIPSCFLPLWEALQDQQDSFQTTATMLGLGVCEILHVSYMSKSLFPVACQLSQM